MRLANRAAARERGKNASDLAVQPPSSHGAIIVAQPCRGLAECQPVSVAHRQGAIGKKAKQTMHHRTVLIASTLLTFVFGCPTPAEKQIAASNDARKEIPAAGKQAQKEVSAAREDLAEAQKEFGDKVVDAQKEVTNEVDEASREIGEAKTAAAVANARYVHFAVLKDESQAAFAARADGPIAVLQADLDGAQKRSKTVTNEALHKNLTEASDALTEAKKDLAELRSKTGKFFDDGRVGVGLAINKAQREMNDAHEGMAALAI